MSDTREATPFFSYSIPTIRTLLSIKFWLGGNWKQLIKQSNLPDNVQTLVRTVVSKSWLTRVEKFDVAEELVQHFQDGHQRGLSFERLIQEFGDPKTAAGLIRRSKLRDRSIIRKFVRTFAMFLLALTGIYLLALGYFHLGRPTPNIDYSVELNRGALAATEDQKAWPLYRSVWTKYQFSEGGQGELKDLRENLWGKDELGARSELVSPTDKQWPQAVLMLKKHQELLDVFRKGAQLPSLGVELRANVNEYSDEDFAAMFPSSSKAEHQSNGTIFGAGELLDGSTIAILLPHAHAFREAARLFHVDTRLAFEEDNSERVLSNVQTVLGLANQVAETSTHVNSLIGMAVANIGFGQLEEVIQADPEFFSESQLARLQSTVETTNIQSWLNYDGERAMVKDITQRCYTDDGRGDGRMTPAGVRILTDELRSLTYDGAINSQQDRVTNFLQTTLGPASLLMSAGRKELLAKADEMFDEIEADSRLPFWKSQVSKDNGWQRHEEFFTQNRIKYHLLNLLMPASQQVQAVMHRTLARQNGIVTALAMHRYRLAHGQFPTEINRLLPDFLSEVPRDIIDGSEIKFAQRDGQIFVYSIGMDHDDDGGVDAKRKDEPIERSAINPSPKDDDFEGDWILWPQTASHNDSGSQPQRDEVHVSNHE